MRYLGVSLVCFCTLLLVTSLAISKPSSVRHEFAESEFEVDLVGDVDGRPM